MDIKAEYFSGNSIAMDTFYMLCGEKLGEGASRSVYRYRANAQYVIKFEHAEHDFSNMAEFDLWRELKRPLPGYRQIRKWFAPVIDISPSGNILFQLYIPDIPKEKLPKRVPACFADLKRENWGILRGQPVCRDYGNHHAYMHGLASGKMKKAEWH